MYEKSIRIASLCDKSDEVQDLVFLRCGLIYNALEMWEDARVMFLMCCEHLSNTRSYAYFNLGIADYHLGLMEEAEKMFSHCNYMNPRNSETWGYLALVLLKQE
jgi:tetratricopeptide (TPR) repeat protein